MSSDEPSPRIILQRIRNRIIEYLELASSFESQAQYQLAVPFVHVPGEIINQWEDWVQPNWREHLVSPTFSPDEIDAIGHYYDAWDLIADRTPNPLPPLDQLFKIAEWSQLACAAAATLAVFQKRGPLPENFEEP